MSKSKILDQFLLSPLIKENDIIDYKELNEYEVLIKLRPKGDQIIYDALNNTIRGCNYRGKLTAKENRNEFKMRLRAMLLHSRLSQKDLSRISGISERTITRYINGDSIPDYVALKKIADTLNCKVDDLYFNGF